MLSVYLHSAKKHDTDSLKGYQTQIACLGAKNTSSNQRQCVSEAYHSLLFTFGEPAHSDNPTAEIFAATSAACSFQAN
jgi:hypothetical protein